MEPDKLQILVRKVVNELKSGVFDYDSYTTYESIKFPEGYTKPPKEEFEAKLQELIDAQPLKELRTKRNTLLDQTDKYIVADYPHPTPEKKQEWLDYRQALRDLPTATEDPANPVWPVQPSP